MSLQTQDSRTSFVTSLIDVSQHNSNYSEACFVKYFALFPKAFTFFIFDLDKVHAGTKGTKKYSKLGDHRYFARKQIFLTRSILCKAILLQIGNPERKILIFNHF